MIIADLEFSEACKDELVQGSEGVNFDGTIDVDQDADKIFVPDPFDPPIKPKDDDITIVIGCVGWFQTLN